MKLEYVLDQLNSFEKNSFLKIINDIVSSSPRNAKEVDNIITSSDKDLKNVDNRNISAVFGLVAEEYKNHISQDFRNATSQLDILTDIVSRDGNCIMKHDWFSRLYEKELKDLKKRVQALGNAMSSEKSELSEERKRDYRIYKACLERAYKNDEDNNMDRKVTEDEQTILNTLAKELELSQEEVKLINYLIVPIEKKEIDEVINELKACGVIFYSKKNHTVYVADEMVSVLRRVRGKEVADKYFRRVLKLMREPQINLICKKHNIEWRSPIEQKIEAIINEGLSFRGVLMNDMFKPNATLTDRKKALNDLCDKGLNITPRLKGSTLEEKIDNLVNYFDEVERDEKVGISIEGYDKLLSELGESIPKLNGYLKTFFELQEEDVLRSSLLLDYNIKPRDVVETLSELEIKKFCEQREIKTRGELIQNIIDAYRDSENLYIENYAAIGMRDLASLKENGIQVKESELGVKFEDLTKKIFTLLGFNVDESLRRSINTKKDKIDILINLGNQDVILVECKTVKESGYNKFSSVSRQLKSYFSLAKTKDLKVVKSLLVAPDFSDDFINECELEYDLNLSLIKASSLSKILEGFKDSNHSELPYKLLMRDVLIQEERILKALKK